MRHALGLWMLGTCVTAKPSALAPRAGKSVCLTGLPRIAGLLHVLRAERGPSPVLALAIVEVGHSGFVMLKSQAQAALQLHSRGSICGSRQGHRRHHHYVFAAASCGNARAFVIRICRRRWRR